MLEQIRKHMKKEEGATAIEYGLMVALIAVAIIVAVSFLADNTCDTFAAAGNEMNTATGAGDRQNQGNGCADT